MTLVKRDNWFSDPFVGMDRFFGSALNDDDFGLGFQSPANRSLLSRNFRVDIFGDDDNYYVVAELPGIKKENIDLKLENAVLVIMAKRESSDEEIESEYTLRRAITVGDDVKADGVAAKLENGMLTVTLPKAEEKKPKAISIQ